MKYLCRVEMLPAQMSIIVKAGLNHSRLTSYYGKSVFIAVRKYEKLRFFDTHTNFLNVFA